MAGPAFTRTIASATYKGNPYVLGQIRFDYFSWGSRNVIFDGSAVPTVGKEVAMEGKDESGGANQTGWVVQMRVMCPAAGRPQHPISVQLTTTPAGAQAYV